MNSNASDRIAGKRTDQWRLMFLGGLARQRFSIVAEFARIQIDLSLPNSGEIGYTGRLENLPHGSLTAFVFRRADGDRWFGFGDRAVKVLGELHLGVIQLRVGAARRQELAVVADFDDAAPFEHD